MLRSTSLAQPPDLALTSLPRALELTHAERRALGAAYELVLRDPAYGGIVPPRALVALFQHAGLASLRWLALATRVTLADDRWRRHVLDVAHDVVLDSTPGEAAPDLTATSVATITRQDVPSPPSPLSRAIATMSPASHLSFASPPPSPPSPLVLPSEAALVALASRVVAEAESQTRRATFAQRRGLRSAKPLRPLASEAIPAVAGGQQQQQPSRQLGGIGGGLTRLNLLKFNRSGNQDDGYANMIGGRGGRAVTAATSMTLRHVEAIAAVVKAAGWVSEGLQVAARIVCANRTALHATRAEAARRQWEAYLRALPPDAAVGPLPEFALPEATSDRLAPGVLWNGLPLGPLQEAEAAADPLEEAAAELVSVLLGGVLDTGADAGRDATTTATEPAAAAARWPAINRPSGGGLDNNGHRDALFFMGVNGAPGSAMPLTELSGIFVSVADSIAQADGRGGGGDTNGNTPLHTRRSTRSATPASAARSPTAQFVGGAFGNDISLATNAAVGTVGVAGSAPQWAATNDGLSSMARNLFFSNAPGTTSAIRPKTHSPQLSPRQRTVNNATVSPRRCHKSSSPRHTTLSPQFNDQQAWHHASTSTCETGRPSNDPLIRFVASTGLKLDVVPLPGGADFAAATISTPHHAGAASSSKSGPSPSPSKRRQSAASTVSATTISNFTGTSGGAVGTAAAAAAAFYHQQQQQLPSAAECGVITYAAVRHVVECAVAPSSQMTISPDVEDQRAIHGRPSSIDLSHTITTNPAAASVSRPRDRKNAAPFHPIEDDIAGRNGLFGAADVTSTSYGGRTTPPRVRRNSAKSNSAHTAASSQAAAMNVGRTGSLRLVAFADETTSTHLHPHPHPHPQQQLQAPASSDPVGASGATPTTARGTPPPPASTAVASNSTNDDEPPEAERGMSAAGRDEAFGDASPLADALARRAASVTAPLARVQKLLAPAFGPPPSEFPAAIGASGAHSINTNDGAPFFKRKVRHPGSDVWPRPRSLVCDHAVAPGTNLHQLRSRLAQLRVTTSK